ncbi:hypothetical protein MNEG_12907 [Monoraphidium neglectum]|uniref:Uncharacterized protein n=1 Tax=Monoraphidium neglectum TaxID=145388 RepID=A0A0D2MJ77_9CHLO|nr:hypothetical protein MNEG_12907 [Monoraphidium neglectum]KIY95055.1 hypothetical protein MNEG_12907 [Monoraphidium neglectum]|eukprot:XP_013894075.1 hypothetical protein MNEG_12907 [Monoraphidium neglectum]
MDRQDKDRKLEQAAQEMFGKSFDECESHERVRVGGKVGGGVRGGDMADPDRAPKPPAVKFGEDNTDAK